MICEQNYLNFKPIIMKKVFSIFAIALMAFACQKETPDTTPETPDNQPPVENEGNDPADEPDNSRADFYCSIEEPVVTKTELGTSAAGKTPINWSDADRIMIFQKKTAGDCYQLAQIAEGGSTFSYVSSSEGAGETLSANVAVYPYDEGLVCEESGDNFVISDIVVPATQIYNINSFSYDSFPMVAVSNDNSLIFKNLCGVLNLNLNGSISVKQIVLKGNSSEIISGKYTAVVSKANAVVPINPSVDVTEGQTEIVLNCVEPVQLDPMVITPFYFSVLPTAFSNGFTVVVTDTYGNVYEKSTDEPNPINRATVLNMPLSSAIQIGVKSATSAVLQMTLPTAVDKVVFSYEDKDGQSIVDEFPSYAMFYLANLKENQENEIRMQIYSGADVLVDSKFCVKTKALTDKYVDINSKRPGNVPYYNDARFKCSFSTQWAELRGPELDPSWVTNPSRQDFFDWWNDWGMDGNAPTCADVKNFTTFKIWGYLTTFVDMLPFENLETLYILPGELFDTNLTIDPNIDLTILKKFKKLNKVILGAGVQLDEAKFKSAGLELDIETL